MDKYPLGRKQYLWFLAVGNTDGNWKRNMIVNVYIIKGIMRKVCAVAYT
ncbi:hypothetical protein NTGM5_790006 [Candidatus Nitrotoga sp. M5]|nr:hypothetical protein NTGM5_790006 [Candidatus Nitrotoga sp. M5]